MVNVEWCHYCDRPECRKACHECEHFVRQHPEEAAALRREAREKEMTKADRDMINNPDIWPCYPRLPLKHRTGDITDPDYCGLMFLDKPLTVYIANLFDGRSREFMQKFEYETLDDLLKVWTVD